MRHSRSVPFAALAGAALLVLGAGSALGQTGLQFDGTNDQVGFGVAAPLGASTFTIETWFRRTGNGVTTTTGTGGVTDAIPLLTKGRGEGEASTVDMNWFLGIRDSNDVLCADYEEGTGQASPGLNHRILGLTPIRNNVWYHGAATFDGTNLRLYLNGALEATVVVGAGRLPQSASIQHAGLATAFTSAGAAAGFFQGQMDEPRVWNVARSQAQIQGSMFSELTSGTGLIGRWGLNDGAGTTALNSIGGSPNGTVNGGASWVTGSPFAIANALTLAGTTGHVTFGAAPSLALGQFTIETWFRRDGTGVTTSTGTGGVTDAIPLLSKGRGEAEGSNVDMNYILAIRDGDDVLVADFEEGAAGASPGLNHPVAGTTVITNGVWHHAAATYDGTTWKLYLDGNLEASLAVGQPPQSVSIQHSGLGTGLNSTGVAAGFFNGALDEARIWNTARSQSQIQSTINTAITTAQPGLVARWGLDEGGGNVIPGSAGTTVNGTIVGAAGTAYNWTNNAPFNLVVGTNAPGAFAAIATSHSTVHLSWTDASTNETGFEVERSTTGPGGPFTLHASLPAGTTLFDDLALASVQEYCYQVRAVGPGGASTYAGPQCATTPAETNNALDFAGTNAYVTFGAAPGLGAATFTLECWFRRDGPGAGTNTGAGGIPDAIPLISKGRAETENSNVDMNYLLAIRASDGVLVADFEEGATGATPGLNHPVAGLTSIAAGPPWHHAAVTYDGTRWRLYLDGCLEADLVVGQPPQASSIQHAALGSALNSTGVALGFFDGAIDEARIWNVARTQAEIQAAMTTAITAAAPGLVGRWSLNETAGTQAFASAGTSINGTIAGAAWTRGAGTPFAAVYSHVITASAGANGTIAPSGAVAVACNLDQSFTLTPDPGYSVATLTVDAGSVAPAGSYLFTNVTASHTIAATFADLTAPAVQVTTPNGGETLLIGTVAALEWDAQDLVGVTNVDLELSRSGPGGPWETIATSVPNTGDHAWTVSGPVTADAWLRATASDAAGNSGSDVSDAAFAIEDAPTGTLLVLFRAEAAPEGVRLRWELGDGLQGSHAELERATAPEGPWAPVAYETLEDGPAVTVLDRAVVGGTRYHYRLVIVTAAGATMAFGPFAVTAGEQITEFALAPVAPNPVVDRARFEFTLPREAAVRLSVLDVQGREVAVLAEGSRAPGRYQAVWDGATGPGRAPAGVYFVRFQAEGRHWQRRLVRIR